MKPIKQVDFGGKKFTFHRTNDPLDVGFKMVGYQLRWISARKSETSAGRPWSMVTKESLPKEFVEELQSRRPGVFKDNLLRNGDLVLAFAPLEIVEELRKENQRARLEQLSAIERPKETPDNARIETERETVPVAEIASAKAFKRE